jgi:hypothetical protein
MVSISRDWWEHLAPKVMHRRRSEVEALLSEWCRSGYGTHWLRVAKEDGGVIRARPGDFVPVVHFVALADRPIFIAPQERVKEGLRTVGSDQFRSGHTLDEGELALRPEIRLDVVRDQALLAAAARLDTSPHVPGVKEPSQVFSAPARFLIAPTAWPKRSYISTYLAKGHPIRMTDFSTSASQPEAGKSVGRSIAAQSIREAHCCFTANCARNCSRDASATFIIR